MSKQGEAEEGGKGAKIKREQKENRQTRRKHATSKGETERGRGSCRHRDKRRKSRTKRPGSHPGRVWRSRRVWQQLKWGDDDGGMRRGD